MTAVVHGGDVPAAPVGLTFAPKPLVHAAATSALGQTQARAAGPADSATQGAVSIPDFSGRWGRNAFNFEPVEGGPKPVVNLARMPDGTSNIGRLVGDFRNPILKPGAADKERD